MTFRKSDLLSSWSTSQQGLLWSEYGCFYTADTFAINLGLMVHCHMPEHCEKKKKGVLCSRSRSQWNLKLSMNVCPDFLSNEPFITKLGIVMHHHELEWNDLFAVFKVNVTAKASYDLSMTLYYVFWTAVPFQANLVWWHKVNGLFKKLDCFVVFKVSSQQPCLTRNMSCTTCSLACMTV